MTIDIWNSIKKKQFQPVYLLYGSESYLINETKQLLIQHVLHKDELDFNLASYDLEETPIEMAIEDAETFPFMGEKRLIFLQNPVFLTAEKTKSKVEHNVLKLEQYLSAPAPYTILVISASYEKLDERKKITKELKRKAAVLEAKKLSEHELKVWIRQRAAHNGVQIDEAAIDLMITLSGTDLMMLTNEIDKIALYAVETKHIDTAIVELLVARSLDQNIFALIDHVINRKIDAALRIYYDLLKQNEEPIKILALLASQFRMIYQVKELSRRGYGQQQIAGYIKVHPFRVKLAAGQVNKFSEQELLSIMSMIADMDYQMKTSYMNKEMIVEMFLFKLHHQAIQKR